MKKGSVVLPFVFIKLFCETNAAVNQRRNRQICPFKTRDHGEPDHCELFNWACHHVPYHGSWERGTADATYNRM